MTDTLDVTQVVAEMNANLISLHFKPRDADGSDFQYGDDRTLRFKTGTSRGEVAIQVWKNDQCTEVIRILNVDQVAEAKHQIDKIIAFHGADQWPTADEINDDGTDHCGRSGGMLGY